MSTNSLKNQRLSNNKPKTRFTQYQTDKKAHATMGVPFTQYPDPNNFLKKCTGRRCYSIKKEQTATIHALPTAESPNPTPRQTKSKADLPNPTQGGSKSKADLPNLAQGGSNSKSNLSNPKPTCSKVDFSRPIQGGSKSKADLTNLTSVYLKSQADFKNSTPDSSKSKVELSKPEPGPSKSKTELPPKKNFILDNINSISKMKPKKSLPAVVLDRYGTKKPALQPEHIKSFGKVPSYLRNLMKGDKDKNKSDEEDFPDNEKWKAFKQQCKSLPQLEKSAQETEEREQLDNLQKLQMLVERVRRRQLE